MTDVSITVKPIMPAAVFIVVEILLAAETISVILLDEMGPRSPGAGPIAILLTVALLANLGLVCAAAAAIAANAARRSERARARALIDSFTAVGTSDAGTESDGFVSPACGAFTSLVPAQLAGAEDPEDLGVGLAAFAMAASG